MSKSTKMNPGGGIISNHTATKNIMFIQGSGVGAVTKSNWHATRREVSASCAKKTCVQK
jgi:hypothetical protein